MRGSNTSPSTVHYYNNQSDCSDRSVKKKQKKIPLNVYSLFLSSEFYAPSQSADREALFAVGGWVSLCGGITQKPAGGLRRTQLQVQAASWDDARGLVDATGCMHHQLSPRIQTNCRAINVTGIERRVSIVWLKGETVRKWQQSNLPILLSMMAKLRSCLLGTGASIYVPQSIYDNDSDDPFLL